MSSSVEYSNAKVWFYGNDIHREDGPAMEFEGGRKEWWQNNHRHCTNGPAIIYPNGGESWYINGFLHREDGPAVISIGKDSFEFRWLRDGRCTNELRGNLDMLRWILQNDTKLKKTLV